MRRLLILITILTLGGAFAQGRFFGEAVGGQLSLVPGFGLSLSARAGREEVLGPLALRGEVGLGAASGGAQFTLIADALYFLRGTGTALDFYFGGGAGLVAGGGAVFGIRGVAGLEIPIQNNFAFIVEATPTLAFGNSGSGFDLQIVFGPRLYFR